MIDAAKIEELRGLLAADTSTDWQTIRANPAEGADVWWICAKNAMGQEIELGSLQGGWPHPTHEARARLIVAMRNALPAMLDALSASLAREGKDVDSLANQVVREVAELPDRTSPDDMPDMLMVTAQELHDIVAVATSPRLLDLAAENEVLRRERRMADAALDGTMSRAESSESLVAELREKVERLRKALEPFAKAASDYERQGEFFSNNVELVLRVSVFAAPEYHNSTAVQVGDLRRARSELEAGHE